jgi:hypothetical protein
MKGLRMSDSTIAVSVRKKGKGILAGAIVGLIGVILPWWTLLLFEAVRLHGFVGFRHGSDFMSKPEVND